ncbi:[Pyruvate dehydrogenase [acetyl-transferring]]-phosphatase 2 [Schistosoma japonicum]|uniref:[Pyruvate dehydrogenase [acetyl-transferring]]-phosphatase 2 n=1 Tax=Schistosoma japonicum TaxID=6182 RepID=A0A4Z2D332_SCHJA|nr:[Pyruvate dehydrogenase [acetyl-transferring]]-phosphatase 1, mitochondrial [Schistosoma japonicum]TNN10849.1 [Pyruvate dehydrogenase [acetyl-transferring]]-phosphatase 2 [Schistosoma japonicum]
MYASIMSKEKLNTALEQLRAYDLNQPYHLIRRLDFVSPKSNRHLKNQAGPPSNMLSAYMRGRLRHYMEDLYSKHNRIMNPSDCLIDAFKRLDEDLCSTDTPDNLLEIQNTLLSFTPDRYLDNSLSRDLLRVNLSGSVGIAGYVSWYDKLSDYPTELYLANVGDCGAVLLREVGPNKDGKMVLTPIKCTKPHNGYCNLDEINRIAMEHPENSVSELFRENGRLLGELAPCRSFGDVRYKWPVERLLQLTRILEIMSTSNPDWSPIPYPYTSPPYLTAIPEVTRFEITSQDRYLVLATDGLWDMLSPEQVAVQLTEILQLIQQQKDFCPATQLLWSSLTNIPLQMSRAILPGPNYRDSIFEDLLRTPNLINKREHRKAITRALKLLSLPPGLARYNRDDITVMIIEFSR